MSMKDFSGSSGDNNNGASGTPMVPSGNGNGTVSKFDPMDFLIDYNQKFANAGKTLFRDEIVLQTLAILIGKNKPNCVLVGPAGVGKTKIAEDIAWRIVSHDPILPDKLKKAHVYELPLSNIVEGSKYVGDLEEKLKAVVSFIADPANDAIVFIDEIHVLVSTDSQTYGKIAQILKPALSRGDIRTIGATTTQEASKFFNDPALNRRFSRVIVDELTNEQTVEILKFMRPGFTAHYNNRIAMTDDLFESVVQLANEYRAAGSHRPDSAITLLDRTCGEAIVNRKVQEDLAKADPALLMALQANPVIQITDRQIKRTALRIMTGNAKKKDFDVDKARDNLKAGLRGQDDVIEDVLKKIRQYDMDLFPKKKPMTLLFTGDSGVGKTEMTKIIAQELTGAKPIILNMTEYSSDSAINRIIGSPAGYMGHESNRELPFDILDSNPYQVILLDEFEKGDRAVQRLFMQVFDEGLLTTHYGKTIDFTRTIIIATTNAGHTNKHATVGFGDQSIKSRSDAVKTLKSDFDTELLNRFRAIIDFHPLDENVYRDIMAHRYHEEIVRIKAAHPRISLPDDIPDADLDELVKRTYVKEFGARPVEQAVQGYIESHV